MFENSLAVTYTWLIVFGPVPRSIKPKSPSRISATADTPLPPFARAGERQLHTVVEQALEDDDETFIKGRCLPASIDSGKGTGHW
jgi:hypothetical protein